MVEPTDEKWSLVIGGPFYDLQRRLGLLGPDGVPHLGTALLLALIAWLPPAVLAVVEGNAWGGALGQRSYASDFAAHSRYFIAVLMFTLMEPVAERRIGILVRQFRLSALVSTEDQPRFVAALLRADRRSSSARTEFVLLALAYLAALGGVSAQLAVLQASWVGSSSVTATTLTLAGWSTLMVSVPLFWFLLLRWAWRFVVWAILLRDIAALDLRLVATHPDRCGGVGFLEQYPPTFAAMVFALSCVAASTALEGVMFADLALEAVGAMFLVWILMVLVVFIGPLLVFWAPLLRLKNRSVLQYGSLATAHNRAFEARRIDAAPTPDELLGAPDISSLADLAAGFEAIEAMRPIPAGRVTYLSLVIAAGLPWLAVAATQMPVEVLLQLVKAFLL